MTRVPKTINIKNALANVVSGQSTGGQAGPLFLTPILTSGGIAQALGTLGVVARPDTGDTPIVPWKQSIPPVTLSAFLMRLHPYVEAGINAPGRVQVHLAPEQPMITLDVLTGLYPKVSSGEYSFNAGFRGFIPITWNVTSVPFSGPYMIYVTIRNDSPSDDEEDPNNLIYMHFGTQAEFWNGNTLIVTVPTPSPPSGGTPPPDAPAPDDDTANALPAALSGSFSSVRTFTHHYPGLPAFWGSDYLNDELQRYRSANVTSHGNGRYTLVGTKDSSAQKGYYSGAVSFAFKDNTSDASVRVGDYVQGLIKLPAGKGYWGALWLMNSQGGNVDEIDIVEHLGHNIGTTEHHVHFDGNDDGFQASVDWRNWTTYGVHIKSNAVDYYINGSLVGSHDGPPRTNVTWGVICNLAIGGSWPGAPDSSTVFPGQMEVASVKVWSP